MQKFRLTEKWFKKLSWVLFLTILFTALSGFRTAYSAPKTVLVLGDSLSAEYGLARGTGWVALLEQRIQDKKLAVQVINASISGDTTSGGLARINDLLKKHQPTTVIIELGGNDGLRGLSLTASEQNFRAMIAASKTAKANVLLVGMQIPPNYGRTYTDQFSAMYGKIAKETKIPLVPFLLAGVADKPELFQADRIHLIAAAHPSILNNVWPYLLPLISK
ncbi:arylesterase [Solimicrobium silvestre]|uniref:Lysophospholipase L1 and related esterase n=1 Tax=Solimicrobium silvestre TaxID=2099400 RepID=A0A2S9GVD2_9BURK|nr:arylesterase [Solimicrobium silvestre]PRC91673.1 Lysophospholipase L1 and related esterase [Solimicrobium silvestre]